MSGDELEVKFRVIITNSRAVGALMRAGEFILDAAEDRPWDSAAQEAKAALEYAFRKLRIKKVD